MKRSEPVANLYYPREERKSNKMTLKRHTGPLKLHQRCFWSCYSYSVRGKRLKNRQGSIQASCRHRWVELPSKKAAKWETGEKGRWWWERMRNGASLQPECNGEERLTLLKLTVPPSCPHTPSPSPCHLPWCIASLNTQHLKPGLPFGQTTDKGRAAWRQTLHVQIPPLPLATFVRLTCTWILLDLCFPIDGRRKLIVSKS